MLERENEPAMPKAGAGVFSGQAGVAGKLAIIKPVLAEVSRHLAQSLDPATDAKFELTLKAVDLGPAGDMLSAHSESIATAAIRAERWETTLLAGVDSGFIFSLIDILFGGSGAEPPFRPERDLTRIELEVVKAVFKRLAQALEKGFAEAGPSAFALEQTHSPSSYDAIGRPSAMAAVGTFDLTCASGGGRLFIAVPQTAFVFLRNVPARRPAHPPAPIDPQWQQLLGNRVSGASVTLTAVLGAVEMTLGDVIDFRPGQIIEMDKVSGHRIALECNGQQIYSCKLAQADGVYSLTVEDVVNREQEFMDDILSH